MRPGSSAPFAGSARAASPSRAGPDIDPDARSGTRLSPSGICRRRDAGALVLPRSGGSLIVREILASGQRDAVGPYPIFSCADWVGLRDDLVRTDHESLVSVAIVADPFGAWTEDILRRCFPDVLIRFKEHLVVRLEPDPRATSPPSAQHRRRSAKRRGGSGGRCRRVLRGMAWALSPTRCPPSHTRARRLPARSLAAQLLVPGMVVRERTRRRNGGRELVSRARSPTTILALRRRGLTLGHPSPCSPARSNCSPSVGLPRRRWVPAPAERTTRRRAQPLQSADGPRGRGPPGSAEGGARTSTIVWPDRPPARGSRHIGKANSIDLPHYRTIVDH